MRCFLGIPVDASRALIQRVDQSIGPLKGFRRTKPSRWHVTLVFMPDLRPEQLDGLIHCCSQALSGRSRFAVTISGFGAFPSADRASVIWLRPEPAEPIQDLHDVLSPCVPAGKEERFHAHITVARRVRSDHRGNSDRRGSDRRGSESRIGGPGHPVRLLCRDQWASPIELSVRKIALYQSDLTDSGSEYTVLHQWYLE